MGRKILAGLALLTALSSAPAFADADDVPVQVQMNNGVVQVMKLERAQKIQARGQGVIIGGVNGYPVGTYAYPNSYTYPTNQYVYPNGYTWPASQYVYPNGYNYPTSQYVYPNSTYPNGYPYGSNPWWSVPDTNGAGHPHQHDYDNYGW